MQSEHSFTARVTAVAEAVRPYLRRFDETHDERAIFAFTYLRITQDLAREPEASFDDPAWVATLTETFAKRFSDAMDGIDAWLENGGDTKEPSAAESLAKHVTKPWADVYLALRKDRSYVLEALVFSMMAHISYDLPLALLEVGVESNGTSHVRDYHRMNAVLAGRTGAVQDEVARRYNPLLSFLDRFAGRYDEFFTNYGIRLARSTAWYNAGRLLDPPSREEARASIERSTAGFIEFVRRPKERWLRILVGAVRLVVPRRRRWP